MITCKSCGSTVKTAGDSFNCSICDTEYWGYTKETLPKEYHSLVSFVNYKNKTDRGATGWLILYEEGKEHAIYNLKQGENIIGRANPEIAPDITIENDEFVSRSHAILNVALSPFGSFIYILNDNQSMNGTYLNSEPVASEAPYELRDGDTIQVGMTKLILKIISEVSNEDDALDLVKKMEQHDTIQPQNFRKTAIITKIVNK